MSSSCTISFVLKMNEPYMRKYIRAIVYFIVNRGKTPDVDIIITEEKDKEDISDIYKGEKLLDGEERNEGTDYVRVDIKPKAKEKS